jgi:hypothetical protein
MAVKLEILGVPLAQILLGKLRKRPEASVVVLVGGNRVGLERRKYIKPQLPRQDSDIPFEVFLPDDRYWRPVIEKVTTMLEIVTLVDRNMSYGLHSSKRKPSCRSIDEQGFREIVRMVEA